MSHFSYMADGNTSLVGNFQNTMRPMPMQGMSNNLAEVVAKCALQCDNMMSHCLMMPDMETRREQCRLLIECASICHQTACMLARSSQYAGRMLSICADVCERCGRECSRHQDDMSQMSAQVCLQCAAACRQGAPY